MLQNEHGNVKKKKKLQPKKKEKLFLPDDMFTKKRKA